MSFDTAKSDYIARASRPGGISPRPSILAELIGILKLHPKGLRRWSVMRAMRDNRQRFSLEIPAKFEAEVERVFRRYCADDKNFRICEVEEAHFFRPRETAGEVWALRPARADFASPD